MDIKALLEALANGEKTAEEVAAEINKGTVPKAVFNEKNSEVNRLKGEITNRDNQIEQIKNESKDSATLQATINQLQQENATAKANYEKEIEGLKLTSALDAQLVAAKARNPQIVKNVLNMDTIKLDNGQILGLAEQLDKLRETDSYLFDVEVDQQQGQGNGQGQGQGGSAYQAGGNQRMNPKPNTPDPRDAGRKRAMARHNIKEEE